MLVLTCLESNLSLLVTLFLILDLQGQISWVSLVDTSSFFEKLRLLFCPRVKANFESFIIISIEELFPYTYRNDYFYTK